jgi:hypothetical protein
VVEAECSNQIAVAIPLPGFFNLKKNYPDGYKQYVYGNNRKYG